MAKDKFDFHSGIKKQIFIVGMVGFLLLVIGAIMPGGGHGDDQGHATEHSSHKADHHDEDQGSVHDEDKDHGHEHHGEKGHDGAHGGSDDHGHEKGWFDRFKIDLWINNFT